MDLANKFWWQDFVTMKTTMEKNLGAKNQTLLCRYEYYYQLVIMECIVGRTVT